MKKAKPKVPGPTVDQQSVTNTKATGLMTVWFAAGWKLRPMNPDYHVDYLLERTEGGELTGKMVYIQQKAHAAVNFKDGRAGVSMELKHLRYYAEKLELPVFLILVDTNRDKAWYLFLQEWIDQNVSKDKLAGTGTTTIKVPEEQSLDDVPAFITAVQRSLPYMRDKYPGSVLAAMSAEERRIMALDPRFQVKMDVVGGKKTYNLLPKEDVSVSLTVTGENVKLFEEHWQTGKPIKAIGGGMFIKGLPALLGDSPNGELAEFSVNPGNPLEVQWSLWPEDNSFRLTLDGTITMGKSCYLFAGRLKGGPLKVELKLPLLGAPDAGHGTMNFSWEFSCWEGNPLSSLSRFDGVFALVQKLAAGERVRHVFHVRGRDIFPGDFTFPKTDDPEKFQVFEFIHFARVVTKAFKVDPELPKISTITVDDDAHVRMLADLATAGVHSCKRPGMKLTVTYAHITNVADLLRSADNPAGSYRAVKQNQISTLLGQNIEVGDLEYSLAPAQVILSPDIRARLIAGDTRGFSTEVRGTSDAVLTMRRVPADKADGVQ